MSLLFSDSKGHALLAYIVKCHQDLNTGTYLGRTHMQKIPYILKIVGVAVPFSYQLYLYGPYSQGITFAIDEMLADDVIRDTSDKPKYSNFIVDQNTDELIEKYWEVLKPYKDNIKEMVSVLSDVGPERLELFTTLHYIYLEKKASSEVLPTKDEIIKTFKKVKGGKFTDTDIKSMLNILIESNIIKCRS